ncbi:hypothetical protein [Abyssisolibacter fermentans]|uniref:hypothetical protein n=1 Tax=Abyssisolibacter fermentans TaxID=1766203 RepID=UPI0008345E88|nr:hypothetical protein [Abyssisolibacter fermentans]
MPRNYNNNLNFVLNNSILSDKDMEEYKQFMKKYDKKSDRYLIREIKKVQKQVSIENKKLHVKNLETLANMDGFVNDFTKRKIRYVNKLLDLNDASAESEVESQFFDGASLLLWFLLLVIIFRQNTHYY